ncbi:MAG TPA: low affinity iron permease family protein [Acidimicrobiia bacterium]|nr:low affinity iron permease family protein [Acidimicrobiia bacterium]
MFERFAAWVAQASGRPLAFTLSVLLVVVWAITGPIFGYNDTWQLVINTATTVITFWMVFVLQHTQNKDTKAVELKLDELIMKLSGADDRLVGIEDATEDTLDRMKKRARYTAQK